MKKSLLVVGIRLREYPRNVVLLNALTEVFGTTEVSLNNLSQLGLLKVLFSYRNNVDGVMLVQPAQRFAPALLVFRMVSGMTIIGDAFTSIYDTLVNDRALARKWSLKAAYYFVLDMIFVQACDTLIFDTEEHKDFFVNTFRIKRRCVIVPVSIDMEAMKNITAEPLPTWNESYFRVLFWGYYIPLQGVEYIIRAAVVLKDHPHIRFTLLGGGQTKNEMVELVATMGVKKNIAFLPPVEHEELLRYTKGADLMLGIFGKSEKAGRVIPNKIIESAALGVPIVTGRSTPVERFFEEGENIFFCNMSDPEDLAKVILKAYNTKDLARIGRGGQEVVSRHFSTEHLCHILKTL